MCFNFKDEANRNALQLASEMRYESVTDCKTKDCVDLKEQLPRKRVLRSSVSSTSPR